MRKELNIKEIIIAISATALAVVMTGLWLPGNVQTVEAAGSGETIVFGQLQDEENAEIFTDVSVYVPQNADADRTWMPPMLLSACVVEDTDYETDETTEIATLDDAYTYVVQAGETVTLDNLYIAQEKANLLIEDGANLIINGSVMNPSEYYEACSLVVWGQEEETGTMTINCHSDASAISLENFEVNGCKVSISCCFSYSDCKAVQCNDSFCLNYGSVEIGYLDGSYSPKYGIDADHLSVTGGSLNATTDGYAVINCDSYDSDAICISGGTVTVTNNDIGDSYCIMACGDIQISGGKVNASGSECFQADNISISGGCINASAGSFAFLINNSCSITGGNIEAVSTYYVFYAVKNFSLSGDIAAVYAGSSAENNSLLTEYSAANLNSKDNDRYYYVKIAHKTVGTPDGKLVSYVTNVGLVTILVPNGVTAPEIDSTTAIKELSNITELNTADCEWYIVRKGKSLTRSSNLSFSLYQNDVNIILEDGSSLSIEDPIILNYNLTLWGQEEGTGKFSVVNTTEHFKAITCNKNLMVNGGTLSVQNTSNYYAVFIVEEFQQNAGTVEVSNSNISQESVYPGFYASGDITITGGSFTSKADKGNQMESSGDITITGGSVTASYSDSGYYYGMRANGSIVIADARVKMTGIRSEKDLLIFDSSLKLNTGRCSSAIESEENIRISGCNIEASNLETEDGDYSTIWSNESFTLTGDNISVYAGNTAPGSLIDPADYASIASDEYAYHYVKINSTIHHYDYTKPTYTWSEDGKTCQVTYSCQNEGCAYQVTYDCEISVVKTAATCTEKGIATYTATFTGPYGQATSTKDVEDMPATGHTAKEGLQNVMAATCTTAGYTGDTICSVCGEIITKGKTIAAKGHTAKDGLQNAKAATCTTEGYTGDTICSVCGEIITKGKIVDAKGHIAKSGLQNAKAATCTTAGYTGDTVCSVCGEIITKGQTIAAKGHTYKSVLTKATLTENGKIVKKCSVCGSEQSNSTTTIYRIKSLTLSAASFTYTGKAQKPKLTVKDIKGKVIDAKYYKLTYSKGLKNVGTYTVTVTFKGNYSGKLTKTYRILPKTTAISKLTAVSKGFTLTWKKQATQTTGYEISYSTSKAFKSAKTVQITKNTTLTKKITKLTAGKKYYVRIRTYKTVGKVTYYSEWSAAQTVTTKK